RERRRVRSEPARVGRRSHRPGRGAEALPARAVRLDRGAADARGRVHPPDGPRPGQLSPYAKASGDRPAGQGGPVLRSSCKERRSMSLFSPTRVLAILAKEFVQLTRDRVTYAMILAIPVMQLMLFGYAINNEPRHLPTAVLAQEDSVFARSVLAAV